MSTLQREAAFIDGDGAKHEHDRQSEHAILPRSTAANTGKEKHTPKLPPELASRPGIASMPFLESPNARSRTITVADGPNTGGVLNQHPSHSLSYQIGVAEDKGNRRTMEDSHSFVVDFDDIRGQGYFGLFDGHAGKHAAEWCGQHFHEILLQQIHANVNASPKANDATPAPVKIPYVLNKTFHAVDETLSQMAAENKTHSGCTAVAAFLRIEDESGGQSFLQTTIGQPLTDEPMEGASAESESISLRSASGTGYSTPNGARSGSGRTTPSGNATAEGKEKKRSDSGSKIRNAVRSLTSKLGGKDDDLKVVKGSGKPPFEPSWEGLEGRKLRRVLYAANAGDARAVLCRGGEALRLTYDHKGSDAQESKRIIDAGGFVMNNRVNGVLAVTRSLGDSSMKDFVVGSPYTTETELGPTDEFLIIACDGLWDVADDQEAVNLVREIPDAQKMASFLLEHALAKFSTDNVTVMVVRFGPTVEGGQARK